MLVTSRKQTSRSSETGLFNRIALFSTGGLTMSMAVILAGGMTIQYPWF